MKFSKVVVALLCSATILAACRTRGFGEDAQSKEVVSAGFEGKRELITGFALKSVDELNKKYTSVGASPIVYKAEKAFFKPPAPDTSTVGRSSRPTGARTREAPEGGGLDGLSNFHVVVSLGPLERVEQHQDLMKLYGGANNVPFKAGSTYQLTDFLNPKMQALLGKQFANQREIFDASKLPDINGRAADGLQVSTVTNCFQAAYEATRGGTDEMSFFFPDMIDYDTVMKDKRYGREIKALNLAEREPGGAAARNAGLMRGDVLMLYAPKFDQTSQTLGMGTDLAHIAVFLDDDLYFEKTGPLASHLYRVVTYKDMVTPQAYTDNGSFDKTDVRIRRFDGERLPSASDAFSVAAGKSPKISSAKSLSLVNPAGAPWSVITPELARRLMIVNQPGLGGNTVLWFYAITSSSLELDPKSQRYRLAKQAFTQDAFWF